MPTYEYHEAANIFPMMEGEAFDELVEDVRKNGLREDIELLDGKILDGRNRHKACGEAGAKPRFKTVTVDDPVAYVLSKNLHRRHLDKSQLGLAAGRAQKLREKYEKAAKERMLAGKGVDGSGGRGHKGDKPSVNSSGGFRGDSRDIIGAQFGVSGPTVDRGRVVAEKGVPELVKAVEQGKMSVTSAAKLANEPADVQREVLNTGKPYKPSQPTKGSDGRGVVRHPATTAMQFAIMAISQLERIQDNDPDREKAFAKVEAWIKKRRKAE